jgi:hypothetical protein
MSNTIRSEWLEKYKEEHNITNTELNDGENGSAEPSFQDHVSEFPTEE